jgi:DNA-binding MarR family transcriptional regulator
MKVVRKSTGASSKKRDRSAARLPATFFLPEHSLPHACSFIANRVSLTLERMYGQMFGLSVVGWRVLAILGAHSPLSAKALAELTAMDQVSISRAVEQLAGNKLVSRRIDTSDRRRVVLRLSKKGEEVYNRVLPVMFACENALISGLCSEDVATVRRIMKILIERSAKVLGDDCDWRTVLETYGYGAPADRVEDDSANRVAAAKSGASVRARRFLAAANGPKRRGHIEGDPIP